MYKLKGASFKKKSNPILKHCNKKNKTILENKVLESF